MESTVTPERRAFRIAEVAAMYGVSDKTVRSWVDRRIVRPMAHTRLILIPLAELEKMDKEALR